MRGMPSCRQEAWREREYVRKQVPVRDPQREGVRSAVGVASYRYVRRVDCTQGERLLQGPLDGADVRAISPTSDDEVPGRPSRTEREQDQSGPVRLSPKQGQAVACVFARAVQQQYQRGRARGSVARWHIEVAIACGVKPQRSQADWRQTGARSRRRMGPYTPFRVRVPPYHMHPSVPPASLSYTMRTKLHRPRGFAMLRSGCT